MGDVVHLPIQSNHFGLIRTKRLRITCQDCDNTDKFYGKATVQPFIVIEKQEEHRYDVTEVGYREQQGLSELIDACASCGSSNIKIEVLQRDVK